MNKKYIGYGVVILVALGIIFGGKDENNDTQEGSVEIQSGTEVQKETEFDTGNIDGFYSHITSSKFKRTCSFDEEYHIIEFNNDNTYSQSSYNKRLDKLTSSDSGSFEVGEIKFADAEEGTFRYIRTDKEEWRVYIVSKDWYEYNGKDLVELTTFDIGSAPKFDGYDEYGPIVWSSNITFATDCETYTKID